MPNDSDTLDVVPDSISGWIEKFNKVKGWKPLDAPSSGKNLKLTPIRRFEEAHAKASSGVLEANSAKVQAQKKVDALQQAVDAQDDPAKKALAEDALEAAKDAFEAAKAADKTARELRNKMATKLVTLTKVEEDLDKDLREVSARVAALQDQLEEQSDDPFAKVPKKERNSDFELVQAMRNLVASNIEKARAEVFKMTKVVDGDKIERSYAVICPEEYQILHAMLDEAMLTYLTGDVEGAKAGINATTDQLNLFRNARTGATIIESRDDAFDTRLSLPLARIEGQISWLRTLGFKPCADEVKHSLDDLRSLIDETQKNTPDTVFDTHEDAVEELAKTVQLQADDAAFCVETTKRILKQIATLRAMDAPATADVLSAELDRVENPTFLRLRRSELDGLEMKWATETEKLKKLQAAQEQINVEKMNKQLMDLRVKYAEMFKSSGWQKGAIKDKKVPKEALSELEMKLSAAEQLLQTDSIDALKLAKAYLDDVESFETSLAENSDKFNSIITQLGLVNKKLDRLTSKYGAYEAGRTVELAARVKTFENTYAAKNPVNSYAEIGGLLDEAVALKNDARARAAEFKECETLAKSVAAEIKALSKAMANSTIGDVQIAGYYGRFVDDLAKVRETADARDEASLDHAKTELIKLVSDIQSTTAVALKRWAEGSRDALSGQELTTWTALKTDCVKGQEKENSREANKKIFDTESDAVKAELKKLLAKFSELNLDSSELDLALKEIASLKATTKVSGDYDDAIKRLEKLKDDVATYATTADEIGTLSKLNAAAATKDCAEKLRSFVAAVKGFDKVIEKVGDVGELVATGSGEAITATDVKAYLDTVAGLVRDADVKKLEDNGALLQKALDTAGSDPRPPREAALSALRTLTGALQANAPLAHFRTQPFTGGTPELDIAVQTLSRLEIKLLTAIPK